MTTVQHAARCLIKRISREHTLEGAIVGTRFESLVGNCLEILSSQLYERSTHFLLELIQNADDNFYTTLTPTLNFSYKPGYLRIDCNEVGFTTENVEAICAISQSTKGGKTTDGEYIGEKGIGFKSVFKAADVVWISSREFAFKFDKTNFLGIVTPQWAEFPEPTRAGWTSFYLQLSKAYEEEALRHELLTFDANLLIFLRRIKEINIRVADAHKILCEQKIWKTDIQQEQHSITILHAEKDTFPYLIRSHTIEDLPNEQKRPNWSRTKVLLGFPVAKASEAPRLVPQNVYAFLPIRNYGLKFLLQGDFLLTASREDIESTLPWNRRIRDAVAEAFLLCVHKFNEGEMRYVWPWYLPSTPTTIVSFFDPATKTILEHLGTLPVLESWAGTMEKASSLKYVPLDLRANQRVEPFTLSARTATTYLSSKYPTWIVEGAKSIGMTQLSPQGFLEDLQLMITHDALAFRMKSALWHSQLAEALVKLTTNAELLSLMQNIRLIPLHDGTWTSATGHSVLFSRGGGSLDIPSGIDVLIVDSSAESDANRRKLFAALGVKSWETPEICRLILELHQSMDFDPTTLNTDQLISHTAFLYQASWQPPKDADIWFATVQDRRCVGRKLYITGSIESDSPAFRVFTQLQKRFTVIHDDYLKLYPSDIDWTLWLVNNLGLSTIPHLITPLIEPKPRPVHKAPRHNPAISPRLATQPQSLQHTPGGFGLDPNINNDIQSSPEINIDFAPPSPQANFEPPKPRTTADASPFPHLGKFPPGQPSSAGSVSLQDYHMQLMLLEQQNKKRLLMARQEQTSLLSPLDMVRPPGVLSPPAHSALVAGEQDQEKPSAEDVPASAKDDAKTIFALSEEFLLMFRECDSSDVLQILRDNWHHYSRWIDGAHMEWQDPDFVVSSTRLKSRLGSSLAQSAKGILPLQELVLPTIDNRLDERRSIPAVRIMDPQNINWSFLSFFGVLIKADVHYYLRCLISISGEQRPDIDDVGYIYEKIQAFYKGNADIIRAAFYERDVILTYAKSPSSSRLASWTNMKNCLVERLAVESQYPSSSYLFRCLSSPTGDPIASIIASATLITTSSRLEDISRLFSGINKALKDVNTSQAAELLRPLHRLSIFPVTDGPGNRAYDRLSFHGKVPLLALSVEDLASSKDMLHVLRLDNRLMSKSTTNQSHPVGRVTTHWALSASLRAKGPFFKVLIPQSHHNRTAITRQIDHLQVSVAPHISQTFMLRNGRTNIYGKPVQGQLSLDSTGSLLHLFLTEESAAAALPPYELVTLLADECKIQDPNHRSLLYTALISSDMESIHSTFSQQGIHVNGLVFDKSDDRYLARRGDLVQIPSPFWGMSSGKRGYGAGSADALVFDRLRSGRRGLVPHEDRRLPMQELFPANKSIIDSLQPIPDRLRGWEHVQHLGEHMVSKALRAYLGNVYIPDRDWTSDLRTRSGFKPFQSLVSCAAFTLSDPRTAEQMTAFVAKFGRSQVHKWRETLQISPPIYHLDVVVNTGSKSQSFVITSSQIERMRQFTMCEHDGGPQANVVILVRLSDVYSTDSLAIDLIVDPWRLLHSHDLTFEGGWAFTGTLQENNSSPTRKRRRLRAPFVRWAMQTIPGTHQSHTTPLQSRQRKETYTYQPLKPGEMRLVHLLPGQTTDHLKCIIIHVPSISAPSYRTLSYVWGTSLQTHELVTPDGVLAITPSLDKALRRLRPKEQPITLWIDAICINQRDYREKEKQVRLLSRTFQNATYTYAFIDGGEDSGAALQMLMQVRLKAVYQERLEHRRSTRTERDEETQADPQYEIDSPDPTISNETYSTDESDEEHWPDDIPMAPKSWGDRCIPPLHDAVWASVEALFTLVWFRRVWIVQEVVAAHNVEIVCGEWAIDWTDLHQAMEVVDRQIQLDDTEMTRLRSSWQPFLSLAAQREWEARKHRWALIMLLERFRSSESTLARDRLFAMLGLACDGNEAEFEPDYESPLEHVLLRYAHVFVRQGRGMQLLYRAGLNDNSHRFPSWIPDWTLKRPARLHDSSENGTDFAASGPQQPVIVHAPDSDELLVEGYAVDSVEVISASSNEEENLALYLGEVDTMVDSAILTPVRESREELKWKVPIAGALYPRVAASSRLDLQSSYQALRVHLKTKEQGRAIDKGKRKLAEATDPSAVYAMALGRLSAHSYRDQGGNYLTALQDSLRGWRFVVTKQGYVGTVPKLAELGDMVAIMKGGRVPFILRKSVTRPGAFRLIGECYVHGIMNGEGLSLPEVVESTFRLH